MSIFSIHTAESAPEAARPILGLAARKFGFVPNLLERAGYDADFVREVARVMEYAEDDDVYRGDRLVAHPEAA